MAIRTTPVTVADGDQLNEGYFNGVYQGTKILATPYTSTAFDSNQTTTGNNSNNHELSVTAANLNNASYIKLKINYLLNCRAYGTGGTPSSNVQLKIEKKYQGGSYSTIFDAQVMNVSLGATSFLDRGVNNLRQYFEYPMALDANDKANGITLKITTTSTQVINGQASFTNSITWIEGAN